MLPPKTFYARRPGHPLLLLCLGVALATLARAAVKEGDAFPKLEPADLKVLVGSTLPDTEGKVVLVDFWASWCAPCKASFPMLAKLNRELGPKGFVVVAVGIDEKPAAADAFVKKLNPDFPTLHDHSQRLVRRVEVPTMPTSFLLGRDGQVRFIHRGFHGDRTEAELRRQIAELLAQPKP
ncbi:MAG: TlpA family protein disulfide reductase [Opitutaceae bacterium]